MKTIRFRFAPLQAFFLAALMLLPMTSGAEDDGSVSGTVYHSDGTTPFTENIIYIEAIPGDDPCGERDIIGASLTSSSDGTYTIENLPPGTYHLRTSIAELNYVNEWWGASGSVTDCSASQSVTIGAGEAVSGKDFQLDAGATVSGTVYQADGVTPFTESSVYIDVISDGACGQRSVAWADTNPDDGTYTIVGLPSGTYHLRTSITELNYVNAWWAESESVTECANAEAIDVQAGESVTDRNFHLESGATLSGTVYQNDGVSPFTGVSVYIDAVSGDPCGDWQTIRYAYTDSDNGTYEVAGLPPGTYALRTSVQGPEYVDEWWAEPESVMLCSNAQSVTVAAEASVTGKDFQLAYEATISGTVYQNDGTTPLAETGVSIELVSGDPCRNGNIVRSVSADASDGTYSIGELTPGTYYLRASGSGIGYVDEWWAEGESSPDCNLAQALTLGPGDSVTEKTFQLAPEARISGTLYQSDGMTPFTETGTSVEAISGDPCEDGKTMGSAAINTENGTYVIGGLPEGSYYLRTVISQTDHTDEWWAESASVTECENAQSVTANSGSEISGRDFQIATLAKGDISGDGEIGLDDAILALKVITGQKPAGIYTDADADGDGRIGMGDSVYIFEFMLRNL